MQLPDVICHNSPTKFNSCSFKDERKKFLCTLLLNSRLTVMIQWEMVIEKNEQRN